MMKLTTTHAASSYGLPVLVDAAGRAHGVADAGGDYWRAYRALLGVSQVRLAKMLGVAEATVRNKENARSATTQSDLLALEALRLKAGKEID